MPRPASPADRVPALPRAAVVLAVVGLLTAVLWTPAATLADKPDAAANDHAVVPRVAAEEFLNLLVQGKVDEAYAAIYQTASPMLAEKEDVKENLLGITHRVFAAYGKPTGHALVRTRTAGDDLIELFYLLRMPEAPGGCRFTYYNGEDGFELIHIELVYDIDSLLEEAAEPAKAPDDLKSIGDSFMKVLISGKAREAYSAILGRGNDQLVAKKDEFAATLTESTQKALNLYGVLKSGTLAGAGGVTADVVQLRYVVRTPKLPLVWTLQFYKSGDAWKVVGVSFNEKYQEILR